VEYRGFCALPGNAVTSCFDYVRPLTAVSTESPVVVHERMRAMSKCLRTCEAVDVRRPGSLQFAPRVSLKDTIGRKNKKEIVKIHAARCP
jgi:hypothetical protein